MSKDTSKTACAMSDDDFAPILKKTDLIAARSSGKILFASDDGFAVAENLLKDSNPEWKEGVYTEYGKWMDGWETRRKRVAGHDWAIIKLGIPGVIHGFNIETTHFTGNYPPKCSIQAAILTPEQEVKLPIRRSHIGNEAYLDQMVIANSLHSEKWEDLVPMTAVKSGASVTTNNYFGSANTTTRFTHIRFNLFPDGGVARLRAYGTPIFDWTVIPTSERVDLVALNNGGECIGYSNAHYGNPKNLISPGRASSMSDGWETARRADRPAILEEDYNGHLKVVGKEWAAFRLGHIGVINAVEVDTHHFKCNFPDACLLEGCFIPEGEEEKILKMENEPWVTILPSQKLLPNKPHYFSGSTMIETHSPVNVIRLAITPDGGISRLRLWGHKFLPKE